MPLLVLKQCREGTKAWTEWLRTTAAVAGQARWIVDQQLERLEAVKEDLAQVEQRLAEATADDPLTQKLLEQAPSSKAPTWARAQPDARIEDWGTARY